MLSPSPWAKAVLGEKAPKGVRSELGKKFYPCWSSEFPEAPAGQPGQFLLRGGSSRESRACFPARGFSPLLEKRAGLQGVTLSGRVLTET